MKCDDCQNLFEEYIDGEAAERDAEQVRAHLITCANCADQFETVTAEQEIYARYDRDLEISPSMWNTIAARTATESRSSETTARFSLGAWLSGLLAMPRYGMAGAMAVAVIGIVLGVLYLRTPQQPAPAEKPLIAAATDKPSTAVPGAGTQEVAPPRKPGNENGSPFMSASLKSSERATKKVPAGDQSDVLFSDIAYSKIEEEDTRAHIAQAQNLLRAIRSIQTSDSDEAVDVTYEKTMSRRLLSENVVLRQDAEASGKFPVRTLLSDLEPFLVDIANLPDKTTPSELRAIKDRVQRTEIVAALQTY